MVTGSGNGRGPGSSPDSIGAGDTLTGCVSTPSSEALDQVSDLRHSRTLPKRAGIISNENVSSNGLKVKELIKRCCMFDLVKSMHNLLYIEML